MIIPKLSVFHLWVNLKVLGIKKYSREFTKKWAEKDRLTILFCNKVSYQFDKKLKVNVNMNHDLLTKL